MQFRLRQTREISFETPEGDLIEFRLEVFERTGAPVDGNNFRVRVWVYELLRLNSMFGVSFGNEHFDASQLVLSDSFDGFEHHGESADAAADACASMMRERLSGRETLSTPIGADGPD